jgi:hypothetical protein
MPPEAIQFDHSSNPIRFTERPVVPDLRGLADELNELLGAAAMDQEVYNG